MTKSIFRSLMLSASVVGLTTITSVSIAGDEVGYGLVQIRNGAFEDMLKMANPADASTPSPLAAALQSCNTELRALDPKFELSSLKVTPYFEDNSGLGPRARSLGEDQVLLENCDHLVVPGARDDILVCFIYGR